MESAVSVLYNVIDQIRSFFLLLYNSFLGSDTQAPYSESYIWMANQFAHFFIGFGGLFLLTWVASYYLRKPAPSYSFGARMVDPKGRPAVGLRTVWTLAAIWLLIWMAKEWLFDYARGSYIAWIYVDPYNDDLMWDTATDSFFYIAGITVALAHFGAIPIAPIPVLAGVIAIAIALGTYWIPARDKIETSGTPYFLRLSGIYPGVNIADLDKTAILKHLRQNDPAPKMGFQSAIHDTDYPFQYLMEPQTNKKQIVTVGNNIYISRFFIALANERVVRQPVKMACNTRYITFRQLLNSDIVNEAASGEPDWNMKSPSGQYSGIDGPGCVIENTELLIIDEVPATDNAASLIQALMSIPGNSAPAPAAAVSPAVPSLTAAAPDAPPADTGSRPAQAILAAATNGPDSEKTLEIFVKALRKKTVIWILDNDAGVEGWTTTLGKYFPADAISFLDLR